MHATVHWAMKSAVSTVLVEALLAFAPGATEMEDNKGCLPLHCIEKGTPPRSIELVLSTYPAAVNFKDFEQATPMHKLCQYLVQRGGIKSHKKTHLLFGIEGNPIQEDWEGNSPLSTLLDGCLGQTEQFALDTTMTFKVLTHWGKQRAPLNEKSIDNLTKLNEKLTRMRRSLREMNKTVQELLDGSHSNPIGRWESNRGLIRQTKQNRSNESLSSCASTLKPAPPYHKFLYSVDSSFPTPSNAATASGGTAQATSDSTTSQGSITNMDSSYIDEGPDLVGGATDIDELYWEKVVATLDRAQELGKTPTAGIAAWVGDPSNTAPDSTTAEALEPGRIDSHEINAIEGLVERDQAMEIPLVDKKLVAVSCAQLANATCELEPMRAKAKEPPENDGFNQAEMSIKGYQAKLEGLRGKRNLTRKVDLIMKMYGAEGSNWGLVKAEGPKSFMKRVFKIARCINTCHKGDKAAFCKAQKKFDCSRYRCPNGQDHYKLRGLDEEEHTTTVGVQQNMPPGECSGAEELHETGLLDCTSYPHML
jgi:hypothetical protein